mmetsp:Transcript_9767/g.14407  ORF Transcript_9767/g.14407 Transcript_9767/m.14407 type:complete len:896 (+) Transcript_9767:42-2729(+)
MANTHLGKKKLQVVQAITDKFVLKSARSESKLSPSKLNIANLRRDSKDTKSLKSTGRSSSKATMSLGSIGEPLSYQEYMATLQEQASLSKKTQDVSTLREIAKKLYDYCPRVMRWNHRYDKSLRHPKVVDLIKIHMSLVNEEAIQERLDLENETWGSMDKKWDTIQDIYELVAYSKDLSAKRNVLLMSKELSTVINKLWKHVSVDSTYIEKKTYFYMHELLYDLLLTTTANEINGKDVATQTRHMFTALERFEAIEHDWKIDKKLNKKPQNSPYGANQDGKGLQFEVFYVSMFEFVDNWTLSTNLEDYVSFMNKIYTQLSAKRINLHVSKLKKKISKLKLNSVHKNLKQPFHKKSPHRLSSRTGRSFKLPDHEDTQSDTIVMDDFVNEKKSDHEILQRLLKKKKEDFEGISPFRTKEPRKGSVSLGQKPMIYGIDSPNKLKPIEEDIPDMPGIHPEPNFENLMKQMALNDDDLNQKQEMLDKLKSIADDAVVESEKKPHFNNLISLSNAKKDSTVLEKKQKSLQEFFEDQKKEKEEKELMRRLAASEKKMNQYNPVIEKPPRKASLSTSKKIELKNQTSNLYHERLKEKQWKSFNQPKDVFPKIEAVQETRTGLPVSVKIMLSRNKPQPYEKTEFIVDDFSHQKRLPVQEKEKHFSIVGVGGPTMEVASPKKQPTLVNTLKLLPSVELKQKAVEEPIHEKSQRHFTQHELNYRFENVNFSSGSSAYVPTLAIPSELHRRESDIQKKDHQALMQKLNQASSSKKKSSTNYLLNHHHQTSSRNAFSDSNSLSSLKDRLAPLYNSHQPITRLVPEKVDHHHVNTPYRTSNFKTKSILTNTFPRPPLRKLKRELESQATVYREQKYRNNHAVTHFGNHTVVIRDKVHKPTKNPSKTIWL